MIGLPDLEGHWRRAWLKAPGHVDHETAVHWMQSGTVYADIRIPCPRPEMRGATALSDLGNATLLSLLSAEGFAGEITLDGNICTWKRDLNWHGRPESVDAGRLRLEAWHELVEDGVHAEYSELWHRSGEASGFARRFVSDGVAAVLVSVGDRFVFGFGQAELAPLEAARTALAAGQRTEALARQFSEGFVFGRWTGEAGVACLATNPLWESEPVIRLDGRTLRFAARDFFGEPIEVAFEPEAEGIRAA